MYFENRSQAGQILAQQLFEKYRYEDCAVVALSDGGVLVGEQIAEELHCVLTLLLSEDIEVPGESTSFGAVSQEGDFTYNSEFSTGEIDGYTSEFHGYLDEKKREAFNKLNRLIGDGGVISSELLKDRTIILVSDGFSNVSSLNVAFDYLKPIRTRRLVVAAPFATIGVIDQLHVTADELHILDVKENFLGIDHYYEDNHVPSREDTIAKINQIILNWR
ncbi:MAG: hypothetical protein WAQ22_01375 [Candidatus Saccharimonas sp.]